MEIAVRAYCDGSGKSNDPQSRFLTLAGLIAPPAAWAPFEREWAIVLDEHNSGPWHAKDAYALTKDFEGWTIERVKALRRDLLNRCFSDITHRKDFVHASCTVDLSDYRRAAVDMPAVGEVSPEALCAFWIAHVAIGWLPENKNDPLLKDGTIELFFDRDEGFQHHIQKEWERRRKNRWSDIVSRIVHIGTADHRDVVGIQAADFLAWHTNRGHTRPETDATSMLISWAAAPLSRRVWDYETLIRAYTLKESDSLT